MTLALDASTPALVTSANDPWTSASFTPPNDSLLVVKIMADWFTSGTPLIAVTSSGLTFERIGRIGAASQGLVEIWIAEVGSNGGTARTVSATTTITDDTGGIKVEVWTGYNDDDPIDAFVCQANNTTNSISPACVTTTDNAWLTGGGVDWQNLGATTSSDTNEHGEPGGVAILSVRKSAATSPAGSPTLNFDASGAGAPLWTWAIAALRADTADPSPIYKVADRGSTQNLTAQTSTAVDLPAGGSIAVGNYLIARLALDNSRTDTAGAAVGVTVTDPRSNTWTVTAAGNADPGAANAGSTCYIAYAKVTNAYTNGDDITFNYTGTGNSVPAKAIIIEEWFGIHKTTPLAVAATTTSGATATGSLARTPTAAGQLVYGALSYEGAAADQITSDPDQTDGSWLLTNQLSTTSGTATSNQTTVGIYKRVTGTTAQTWNVVLPAARDWGAVMLVFDAEPAGGTPVGKDLGLVWDVRSALGDPVQMVWNTRAALGDTLQTVWDVRSAVADTLGLVWHTRSTLGDPLDLRWDTRVTVGDPLQLVWNVQTVSTPIGKDLGLLWNVRAPIGDPLQLVWNTRAALGDPVQLVWNVRIAMGDPLALVWNTRASVGDPLDLRWDVRAAVADTLQLIWNVQVIGLTAVGKDLGLLWNLKAPASKDLQAVWDTRAILADTLDLRWGIRTPIGKASQLVWHTRTVAGDVVVLVWDVESQAYISILNPVAAIRVNAATAAVAGNTAATGQRANLAAAVARPNPAEGTT